MDVQRRGAMKGRRDTFGTAARWAILTTPDVTELNNNMVRTTGFRKCIVKWRNGELHKLGKKNRDNLFITNNKRMDVFYIFYHRRFLLLLLFNRKEDYVL